MKTNLRINYQKLNGEVQRNLSLPILFLVGLVVGLSLATLYTQYRAIATNSAVAYYPLDRMPHAHNGLTDDNNHANDTNVHRMHSADEDVHGLENNTIATVLYKEVRILCWIMTSPENHKQRAIHVKKTWGSRCNKLLFMSTAVDAELHAIKLNASEGRTKLWGKTKEAFQYIYKHHAHDADWFLRADDDTYVILENLRYFLYAYATTNPIYFGFKMKSAVKQGYLNAGAGYVLSKEALRRFNDRALLNGKGCRTHDNGGAEDIEMARCLESVGVLAGDTRDELGRGRFFVNTPEAHLIPTDKKTTSWYWNNMWYKSDEGLDCCSDNAISFHNIRANMMYVLDYLIYHLRPYGIVAYPQALPTKRNFTDITIELLHDRPNANG